jgi:hypothetical protein
MKKIKLLHILFEGEVKPFGGNELVEKIYKDAIAWREKNQQNYETMPVETDRLKPTQKETEEKKYNTTLGQVLNLQSRDILNGAVALNFLNLQNSKIPDWAQKSFDLRTRSFTQQFLQNYTNVLNESQLSLTVIFAKLSANKTSMGAFYTNFFKSDSGFIMQIDPGIEETEIKPTIRHELQHGSQNINGMALQYARALKNPKLTDISQLQVIDTKGDAKGAYGVAKAVTGLRQGREAEASAQRFAASKEASSDAGMQEFIASLKQNPKYLAYLGDDFEYTTWKSDILDQVMKTVRTYESLFLQKLQKININLTGKVLAKPQVYRNLSSDERQSYKPLIQQSIKLQESSGFNFLTRESTSINDLANLLTKDLIENAEALTGNRASAFFVSTIMKLKPREFAKNISIDLTKRLVDYAKEKGLNLAANSDTVTPQQRGLGQQAVSKQQAAQQRAQQQAAQQRAQTVAQQQKVASANLQKQKEEAFREQMNMVPRNTRKHAPNDNFDEDTGRRIVEPEQYRQQFQQWLQTQNNQSVTPSALAEGRMKNFVRYLFDL